MKLPIQKSESLSQIFQLSSRTIQIAVAWNEAPFTRDEQALGTTDGSDQNNWFQKSVPSLWVMGLCLFKYDALKPLFDLNLTAADVPAEPLPQNWPSCDWTLISLHCPGSKYDFRISQNPHVLTPFIDNKQLNNREDLQRIPSWTLIKSVGSKEP